MLQELKEQFRLCVLKRARKTVKIEEQMKFAQKSDSQIKIELLKNSDIFSEVIEQLCFDTNSKVRSMAVELVDDSKVIDKIIENEEDEDVLYHLTLNQHLTESNEFNLIQKGYTLIISRIALNTIHKVVMEYFLKSDEKYRIYLTDNEHIDYEISKMLARDDSEEVKFGLACVTEFDDILDFLADDPSEEIQIAVAENYCTRNNTLYKLSKKSLLVKLSVVSNEHLSERIYKQILHNSSPEFVEEIKKIWSSNH